MAEKNLVSLVREILEKRKDPLNIRKSTSTILFGSRDVKLQIGRLLECLDLVQEEIEKRELLDSQQFGVPDPSPQLVFFLDVVNFCFWAPKGEEKWTVEYPKGRFHDGWFGLVAVFTRALKEGFSILDPSFISNLTLEDWRYIFRPSNGQEIPLLSERLKMLKIASRVLLERYQGSFSNFLARQEKEASSLLPAIVREFSVFEDKTLWEGKEVSFYKRAQILIYDLSMLPGLEISGLEALTVFPDYKLPQVLHTLGILEYSVKLEKKLENYETLPVGSREEVEIRANTIWAGELLSYFSKVPPVLVDNALWVLSQDIKHPLLPYHRVLTTAY